MLRNLLRKIGLLRAKRSFQNRRAEVYDSIAFGLAHERSNPKIEINALLEKSRALNSKVTPIYEKWSFEFLRYPSLSKSIAGTVPESERTLIASAEETQNLKEGLTFLARFIRKIDEVSGQIFRALGSIAPKVVILVFLIFFISDYFIPSIQETVGNKLSASAKVSVQAFHYSKIFIAWGILGLSALLAFVWYPSLAKWTGKTRRRFEFIIFYSKYRDIQAALLLMNIAFLTQSHFTERRSLETIRKNATPYIKWHIDEMLSNMNRNATDFGRILISTGLFNRELSELILSYTRWTDWHTQLEKIASQALDIVVRDLKKVSENLSTWLTSFFGMFLISLLFTLGSLFGSLFASLGIAVSL